MLSKEVPRQSISLSGQQCDQHRPHQADPVENFVRGCDQPYLPTNRSTLSLDPLFRKMSLSSAAAASLATVQERDFTDDDSVASSSRDSKAPSVTDWEGDEDAPEFVTIGHEHCRCLFKYKHVTHTLVCGNLAHECRRGHNASGFKQAPPGIYKAHLYRKQLNGIDGTHTTEAQLAQKMKQDRLQLRDYALELGSGKFDATPPETEMTFTRSDDPVPVKAEDGPKTARAQKASPKPAFSSFRQMFSPKAPALMSMKPKVPDMSLPFPKKVSASAPPSTSATSTDAGMTQALVKTVEDMTHMMKALAERMDANDHHTTRLRQEMIEAQRENHDIMASMDRALDSLTKAQVAQAARMRAHDSTPVSAPGVASASAPSSVPVCAPTSAPAPASTSTFAPTVSSPAVHGVVPGPHGHQAGMHAGGAAGGTLGGRDALPPTRLLGVDKSKEKDELFKIQLRSEAQLKQDMSPPGVSAATRDDLAANMVDAVSLPGTFSGSEENSTLDGTHQVAEAMRELMAQSRGDSTSERVRVDHGWRSARRISLNAIKSNEQLQTQYGNLTDISDEVLSHFVQSTLAILQAGRLTDYVAEQWSQNGFYTRLVRDSVMWYTDLHLHLLNINLSHGWDRVQVELKYHSNKLGMIRTSASNRLVCLCKTYCYLRNGKRNQWTNDDLLSKRIDHMSLSLGKKRTPKADKPDGPANLCRKCRTNCHAADVPCPWKNMKDADARKAAAAWMANPVAPS